MDNLHNRIHALKPEYYIQTFLGSYFSSSKKVLASKAEHIAEGQEWNRIVLPQGDHEFAQGSQAEHSGWNTYTLLLVVSPPPSPPSPSSDLHIIHSRKEYFKVGQFQSTVWNTYLSVSWGLEIEIDYRV